MTTFWKLTAALATADDVTKRLREGWEPFATLPVPPKVLLRMPALREEDARFYTPEELDE